MNIREFLKERLDRKSEIGLRLTVNVVVFALAVWALGGLLDAVLDNDTLVRWDLVANNWYHTHATPAGLRMFSVITEIGSAGVWVVVVLVALWLWRVRHERSMTVGWVLGNLGGDVIQYALKTQVHRARPQYAAAFLHGHTYSFPSGHTMATTIAYLLLAWTLSEVLHLVAGVRVAVYICALLMCGLIGFSRVYLGVHYPSDVVGGFTAGLAWVTACASVYHLASSRRALYAAAAAGGEHK